MSSGGWLSMCAAAAADYSQTASSYPASGYPIAPPQPYYPLVPPGMYSFDWLVWCLIGV